MSPRFSFAFSEPNAGRKCFCCCYLRRGVLVGIILLLIYNDAFCGFLWASFIPLLELGTTYSMPHRALAFCSFNTSVTAPYRAGLKCYDNVDPCKCGSADCTLADFEQMHTLANVVPLVIAAAQYTIAAVATFIGLVGWCRRGAGLLKSAAVALGLCMVLVACGWIIGAAASERQLIDSNLAYWRVHKTALCLDPMLPEYSDYVDGACAGSFTACHAPLRSLTATGGPSEGGDQYLWCGKSPDYRAPQGGWVAADTQPPTRDADCPFPVMRVVFAIISGAVPFVLTLYCALCLWWHADELKKGATRGAGPDV